MTKPEFEKILYEVYGDSIVSTKFPSVADIQDGRDTIEAVEQRYYIPDNNEKGRSLDIKMYVNNLFVGETREDLTLEKQKIIKIAGIIGEYPEGEEPIIIKCSQLYPKSEKSVRELLELILHIYKEA